MGFDLEKYLDEELPVLDAVDMADPSDYGVRPTANELWLWHLEETASRVAQHRGSRRRPEGGYDPRWQYGHRHCLRTAADVRAAPDDVLLEALGLPGVYRGGWLDFMRRELWIYSKVANNWGLPSIHTSEPDALAALSGESTVVVANEDERRAYVARLYIGLMREEYGDDIAALVNKMVHAIKANHEREHGRPMTEDELRALPGFLHPLHTCGSFTFRDRVRGDASVKYRDAQRDELLAWVRRTAENRRRHRHAPHPTDCAEKQEVFEREEELARERRDAEEKLRDEY